jgi:hypothetical protein
MNDESDFNQWLQRELTRPSKYLNDDGFTDKVMAALPAQRPRGVLAPAIWTILLALLAGGVGLALFPGWDWTYSLLNAVVSLPLLTSVQMSLLTLVQMGLGFTLILGTIAAAILWNEV